MARLGRIIFSLVPKGRYDEFANLMAHQFETSETVAKALDLYPNGDIPQCLIDFHRNRLEAGASLFAQEHDTRRLVGILTNAEVSDRDILLEERVFQHMHSKYPDRWDGYRTVKRALMGGCSSVGQLAGCSKIYHMHDMLVLPEYRRLGIGHELLQRSLDMAKAGNYEIIVGMTTTIATYRMFTKLGFEILNKVNCRDILINGRPLLPDPQAFLAYMAYRV